MGLDPLPIAIPCVWTGHQPCGHCPHDVGGCPPGDVETELGHIDGDPLGGNETAARLSGLPTRRLKAVAYGLSGLLASLGGILFTGRSGQADARLGVSYELIAITAAVVGGCSLSGGVGSIRGTVLGLVLIQIVIKATGQLAPQGIDSTQVEGLVLGTVVVLAVAFNQRFRGRG